MKNCLKCVHMRVDEGEPAYSELTPGWDCSMHCQKQHWTKLEEISNTNMSKKMMGDRFDMAIDCCDYEEEA